MPSSRGLHYVFIDGGYLRQECERIGKLYDLHTGYKISRLAAELGDAYSIRGQKYFYYDCIGAPRQENEDETAYQSRLRREEEEIYEIESSPRFHVRLGKLSSSRSKKRPLKQIGVDVTLTLDMIIAANDGIIGEATLIAGDSDFHPLIREVVRRGVHVRVMGAQYSCHRELRRSADQFTILNTDLLLRMHGLGAYSERAPLLPPSISVNGNLRRVEERQLDGILFDKSTVYFFHPSYQPGYISSSESGRFVVVLTDNAGRTQKIVDSNPQRLQRYITSIDPAVHSAVPETLPDYRELQGDYIKLTDD